MDLKYADVNIRRLALASGWQGFVLVADVDSQSLEQDWKTSQALMLKASLGKFSLDFQA